MSWGEPWGSHWEQYSGHTLVMGVTLQFSEYSVRYFARINEGWWSSHSYKHTWNGEKCMSWLYERGYGGMTLNMAVNLDMTRLTDWNSDFLTVIFPFLVIGMSCKFLGSRAWLLSLHENPNESSLQIIQKLPLITQIFILRGHLKIIFYPRNVRGYHDGIMMGSFHASRWGDDGGNRYMRPREKGIL